MGKHNVFRGMLWLFGMMPAGAILAAVDNITGIGSRSGFNLVYWFVCNIFLYKACTCFADAVGRNHPMLKKIIIFLPILWFVR